MVDYNNPALSITIASVADLLKVLFSLRQEEPRFIDLISPDGKVLTLAIGQELGCAQITSKLRSPPYLVAINHLNINNEGFLEFDAGGTPTLIPLKWCLPINIIVEIANTFFVDQTVYLGVEWEEI